MRHTLVGAIVLAGLATQANASITSISTGDTLMGDRGSNLIANGSFETGNAGVNLGWTPGTHLGGYPGSEAPIPSWTPSYPTGAYGWWGPLGFSGDPAPHGNNAVYFGNSFNTAGAAVSGIGANGVITFAGSPTFSGRPGPVVLSQAVSGLSTSTSYQLEFWVSGESNTSGFTGTGLFGLDISGSGLTYLLMPSSSNAFGGSERFYVDFTPTSSSVTISFLNWGHMTDISGTGSELVLDDVILNVPAPASLAALAVFGLAAGRRRRA